ncbi:MAG TPA: nuclear transport factor 2 family protein [Gemmatimonadaceae bacterium]|nr:nuclear transport factor 2 family protein [Gemmatimonadaceae bacterium]
MSAIHSITRQPSELSRQNARVLAELYQAFVQGDDRAALHYIARDNIHHVPGRGRNAGEYWGHEGFARFMENIRRHNGGVFAMSVPVFSVAGDDAFTREIIRINRADDPNRIWTLRISNRFRMRDGRVAESWVIPEDQRDYDDYWSLAPQPVAHSVRIPYDSSALGHLDEDHAVSASTAGVLREMYRRFWAGNLDSMREMFDEEVIVNIAGRSSISGEYFGWEGFLEFRRRLMALAGNRYKLDVVALAASDTDAWATEHIRMNRSWDPAVHELFVQMHFEIRDGRIVRMNDFPIDTHAWERFFTMPFSAKAEGRAS